MKGEYMASGVKTLVNNCDQMILVTLLARAGDNPQTPTVRRVSVNIGAHQSATATYGDDQNPFLNGIILLITDGTMYTEQALTVIQRGGPGTLDNKLNAFSVFEFGYDSNLNAFTFSQHN
jgi:hypothetical protein